MMGWSSGLVDWIDGDTASVSVAFSWKLPEAYQRSAWYKAQGYKVRAGGPGTFANHKYLLDIAEVGGEVDALPLHNSHATYASRGCPVGCYFCIVPKMEGKEFTLLPDFIPRPILCDNNLSALPIDYQNYIIEKYQKFNVPLLNITSGFEPRSFNEDTYKRWKVINKGYWRFAYDELKERDDVYRMTKTLADLHSWDRRVYVLIGNEPFADCLGRIMEVIEWKCEPFVQPMIALNALEKKPIIRFDWTEKKLHDLARWANRWIWRTVPFLEYKA